jgi:hypothetical protein
MRAITEGAPLMANVKVCDGNWNGVKGQYFTWVNDDDENDAIISQAGSNPWPFTTPSSKPYTLTVPMKTTSPGTLDCQLIDQPDTYYYDSNPCDTLGNPKTVIIT